MIIDKAALSLVIIGALNWLLVGLFQYDLVASIFGEDQLMQIHPGHRLSCGAAPELPSAYWRWPAALQLPHR